MCVPTDVTFVHFPSLLHSCKTSSRFFLVLLDLVAVGQLSAKQAHKSIRLNRMFLGQNGHVCVISKG